MKSRNSINSGVRLCAALAVGVGTLLAAPNVRNVDCPKQSLGDAVAKADPGDTLLVTGICHERVVITTDRLTILRARRVTIPHAGHHPHLETPDRFTTAILEFLTDSFRA